VLKDKNITSVDCSFLVPTHSKHLREQYSQLYFKYYSITITTCNVYFVQLIDNKLISVTNIADHWTDSLPWQSTPCRN